MREIIARLVCLLAVAVVVALAHVFAERHNPRGAPAAAPRPAPAAAALEPVLSPDQARGREVYDAQGCASCHAIAGEGNPRNPLDDVGARRSVGELRDWIAGTGPATGLLAPAVVKRKQRYRELPDGDLQALAAYLATLGRTP